MRKKIIVGIGLIAAVGVLATAAFAAVGVKFTSSFSPAKAGKPTGVGVSFEASDPAAPQPPIMTKIQINFQKGGKWNGAKFPKCSSSTLLSKGPSGCPKGSKIGTGTGVGYAKPVVTDPVAAKLTIFNGGNAINVFVLPDLGPTFVTPCKISGGYNLTCTIPPIKTLPSAPDAAVGTVKTKTSSVTIKKGKKKIGLVVAPKSCKKSWTSSATFTFIGAADVKASSIQKCKK
jgi:hypothetical protein